VSVTPLAPDALADGSLEADSCDVIICHGALERLEPEQLQEAGRSLYRALRPGGQLLLGLASDRPGLATDATILVALLRAGLEVVEAEVPDGQRHLRLLRPLELPDIVRFSGL